jgi:hypothetical protein
MTQVNYDFADDVVPPEFLNETRAPWAVRLHQSEKALSSSNNGLSRSIASFIIAGIFESGTLDMEYLVSSENNFDIGSIKLDGVELISSPLNSGSNTVYSSIAQQSISAGAHVIKISFIKDNSASSNSDRIFIKSINMPTLTSSYQGSMEIFGTVLPAGWTNDATLPWIAGPDTVGTTGYGWNNAIMSTELANNTQSSIEYTSPSSSPAGVVIFEGWMDAVSASMMLEIDATTVYVYTGNRVWSGSNVPIPSGFVGAVTSGSHTYKITAIKGSGDSVVTGRAFVMDFFEPSFAGTPPVGFEPWFVPRNIIIQEM